MRVRRRSTKAKALGVAAAVLGVLACSESATAAGEPRIAFTSARNAGDVFAMAADGSGEAAVTHGAPESYGPSWSPDGSSIAFTGRAADGSGRLWAVSRTGAELRTITKLRIHPLLGGPDFDPDWSPNGKRLVFSYGFDIFTVRADGTDRRRLTGGLHHPPHDDWSPSWSPDGRSIVFVRDGLLRTMRPDGSRLETISPGGDPDWSPSGRRIVFTILQRNGNHDLFTSKADGSDRRRLTRTRHRDELAPSWSPRGGKVAYARGRPWSVWVIRTNGTDAHRMLRNAFTPAWSPSGSSLSFSRAKILTGDPEQRVALFALQVKSATVTRLVAPEFDGSVTVSPDGAKIAFASLRPFSQSGVYGADSMGQNETFLHSGGSPAWSPDGSQILLLDTDGLYVIDSDGSNPTQLPAPVIGGKLVRFVSEPAWRPDGEAVSFVGRLGGCRDAFAMGLDGSNITRVTSSGCEPGVNDFDWSPDGGTLVFSGETCVDFDCTDQIFSATPPDATPVALTPRNLDLFDEHPAVSPDGTKVAFERLDAGFLSARSVWLLSIDGAGKTMLTATGADGEPAWWP